MIGIQIEALYKYGAIHFGNSKKWCKIFKKFYKKKIVPK